MEEQNTISTPQEQTVSPSPEQFRKVSPFADSPYCGYYDQENQTHPETPVKQRTSAGKPAGSRPRWLVWVLAVALTAVCCTATAMIQNGIWQRRYDAFTAAMNNRLDVMQKKLDTMPTGGTYENITVPTEGMTPAEIFAQYANSVVVIRSNVATGTGFIISQDGYIVSNYHVIEDAAVLRVIMYDGRQFDAEVIGYDASNDVSLVKIDGEGLTPVKIGSSTDLRVGDQVVAIGNALGDLTSSLTVGYISGKDRVVSTDGSSINMLQTDAAINSGNSGGPLFNMKGEVVGINTAKYGGLSSSGATIEGIGFAIPIDDVVGMLDDLRQFGYVVSPYLGVSVRDVSEEVIQYYGFPAGAYVDSVVAGLSAEQAGVCARDIIVNLGGYKVTSVSELTRVLRKFKPNETTTITVYRNGVQIDLEITLGEKPAADPTDPTEPTQQEQLPQQNPWWYEYMQPFYDED